MQTDHRSSRLLPAGFLILATAAAILFWFVSAPQKGGPVQLPNAVHAVKKPDAAPASPEPLSTTPVPSASTPFISGTNVPADHAVATILAENPTVDAARAKLLESFPKFTEQEKIAAAPHLVNLVTDEHLPSLVNVLQHPNTPTAVKEVIFDNMLNRPPELGWPVLLQVMAVPGHPLAQRARETLTIVVGANHQDRLDDWQRALNQQLEIQAK